MSAIVATALLACASTACSSADVAAAEVWLAPAVDPGADPFTDSVQIGPVPTIAPVAMDAAAAQRDQLDIEAGLGMHVAVGSDPALFGGSPGTQVCDPDQLVTLLTGDPDKAAAWAGTLGVGADEIAVFVATLTPVVLTSDTLVTNHTYRDGDVTEVQSVLEAGTAVLVAAVGVPQVKCNSGNPLTEPAALDADATTFVGDEWDGFEPDEVIAVEPGDPVDTFTLLDVGTGTPFDVPAGGGPAGGGPAGVEVLPPPDGIDGTWTVSPDGLNDPACLGGATIVIDGTTATMSRSGIATISGTVDGGPSATAEIAESVDGFVIHLGGEPPDEIQLVLQIVRPDRLLGSISPDCDEFVNVTRDGSGPVRTATDPEAEAEPAADGGWVAVTVAEDGSSVLTSADGARWTEANKIDQVYVTGLAHGAGTWVAVGYTGEFAVTLASPDLVNWTQTDTFDALGNDWFHLAGVAYGDGRFVAVGTATVISEGMHKAPLMYTSTDGVTWTELTGFDASVFEPVPSDPALGATGMGLEEVDYADGRFVIAGHSRVFSDVGWPEQAVAVYELADGSDQPAVLVPWQAVGDNETALAAGGGKALFSAVPGVPTANADPVTSSLLVLTGASVEAVDGTPLDSTSTELLAYGPNGFRAIVNGPRDPGTGIPDGPAQFYSSADGVDWELLGSSPGNFFALASGPVAATATPTTAPAPTPTTAPASTPTTTTVPAPAATTAPPAPVAPALSTVCVRSNIDFAALRAEPSLDGALLAEIPPGSCDVGLLDPNEVQRNGISWYHVLWQGIEGWTAASNTTRTVTAPPVGALGGPPSDWTVNTPSGVACPAPDVTPQDGWWAGFTDFRGGVVDLSGSPVKFSLRCDPEGTLRTMERAPGAPVVCVNYGSYALVPCPAALQGMFLWIRIEGGVVGELVGAYVGG